MYGSLMSTLEAQVYDFVKRACGVMGRQIDPSWWTH